MWFTEAWTPNINFQIRVKEHIYSEKTPFQQLEVYDSFELGRFFFTLDGIMMANEKDEFIYHEMIIHTPMSINPKIKHVLVIGGDGGSVRELAKYPHIETIDMVEIDEAVVRACQKHFQITTTGLN